MGKIINRMRQRAHVVWMESLLLHELVGTPFAPRSTMQTEPYKDRLQRRSRRALGRHNGVHHRMGIKHAEPRGRPLLPVARSRESECAG